MIAVPRVRDDVRNARDAEAAHLEAVLRVFGAPVLRLQRLRDWLADNGVADESALDLKLVPGEAPRLWLGLSHCVTMEPDAGTYRLSRHESGQIVTLLETGDMIEFRQACRRHIAHQQLHDQTVSESLRPASERATMVYVWLTGLLTGVAAVAVFAMILKRLPF